MIFPNLDFECILRDFNKAHRKCFKTQQQAATHTPTNGLGSETLTESHIVQQCVSKRALFYHQVSLSQLHNLLLFHICSEVSQPGGCTLPESRGGGEGMEPVCTSVRSLLWALSPEFKHLQASISTIRLPTPIQRAGTRSDGSWVPYTVSGVSNMWRIDMKATVLSPSTILPRRKPCTWLCQYHLNGLRFITISQ